MSSGSSPVRVRVIPPSGELRRKAEGYVRFDDASLAAAERAMATVVEQHEGWCQDTLDQLRRDYEIIHDALSTHQPCPPEVIESFLHHAQILSANGSVFDYDLVTRIGDSLSRYIRKRTLTAEHLPVIDLHLDSLAITLHNDLKGDGGELGSNLMQELQEVMGEDG